MKVFDGQAANGNSLEFKIPSGGALTNIWVAGNLGGGTVTVEAQAPDDATWVPINGGVMTEAQMITIESAPFVGRLTLTGSAGASVDAWVESDTYYWRKDVEAE